MKIVDVSEFYSERGGGVRTYVGQKLAAAAAQGHEVVVVAPGPRNAEVRHTGGRIRWVESPRERFDARYHRFVDSAAVHAILTAEAPDVIEASSPWTGGQIVADFGTDVPKVLVLHNDPVAVYGHTFLDGVLSTQRIDRLCTPLWRKLARLSGAFSETIVAGEWLADRFTHFGLARCRAIPFGVETQSFSPTRRDAVTRRRLLSACGVGEDAALLVAVARHHPEKRIGVIINAVARLAPRRRVGLYLIGDGPLRPWVDRIAAQVDGVSVAGRLEPSEVAACLANADALVHASAAETFGLAVAEALCSGLPVVLPDRGGASAFFDPAYAESYRTGDAADCANAIERLLNRPWLTLSAAAARSARSRVRSCEQHFHSLFAHYAALVDQALPNAA